jgi:Exostosin family
MGYSIARTWAVCSTLSFWTWKRALRAIIQTMSHSDQTTIIETCDHDDSQNRPYIFSCVEQACIPLHREIYKQNDLTRCTVLMERNQFARTLGRNITYERLLQKSIFAAAPRGDDRFSYRFTKVLSAGAIPVVHSDDWVLPFRKELIDWPKECSVVIPEAKLSQMLEILYLPCRPRSNVNVDDDAMKFIPRTWPIPKGQ